MLQLGRELHFTPESFIAHIGGDFRHEHFCDHGAIQRIIARDEHAAHSAAAKLALDRIVRAERGLECFLQVNGCGRMRVPYESAVLRMRERT